MPSHLRTSSSSIDAKIRRALPRLYAWYQKNQRPLPWRQNPNPYRITVSEFMAQQTRMATVIPYYRRWIRRFPNWSSLAKASVGVKGVIHVAFFPTFAGHDIDRVV